MATLGSSSSKTNGLLPVAASQMNTGPSSSRPGTHNLLVSYLTAVRVAGMDY